MDATDSTHPGERPRALPDDAHPGERPRAPPDDAHPGERPGALPDDAHPEERPGALPDDAAHPGERPGALPDDADALVAEILAAPSAEGPLARLHRLGEEHPAEGAAVIEQLAASASDHLPDLASRW